MFQTRNVSIRYEENDFSNEHEYESFEDQQLIELMDQILTEVFLADEDKESLQSLEGNAIYDLSDEREIRQRESYDSEILNEGSPDVEELDLLMEIAEGYFANPIQYPIKEETIKADHVSGFIQILAGMKVNAKGEAVELWKSVNIKIVVSMNEFNDPERIIEQVESKGFKWSPIIRICFYGEPLREIIGEQCYSDQEPKLLVQLSSTYSNILLAIPAFVEFESEGDSIYDFVEDQIQENILYGILPDFGRTVVGHWEMTHIRLDELEQENLENKNLLFIQRRERRFVAKKNAFNAKYSSAYQLIKEVNKQSISLDYLFQQEIQTLKQILFLTDRRNIRIDDPKIYLQVRALVTKNAVTTITTQQTQAFQLINKVNNGEHVDFHLLNLDQLEEIFSILWSYSGIRINSAKKAVYYLLKNNLLRLRAKKHAA